jgi:hypothetical protein
MAHRNLAQPLAVQRLVAHVEDEQHADRLDPSLEALKIRISRNAAK